MTAVPALTCSQRSYEIKCHENVTLKENFYALRLFHVVHECKKDDVSFHLIVTNGFYVRGKELKISCCGFALSSERQI